MSFVIPEIRQKWSDIRFKKIMSSFVIISPVLSLVALLWSLIVIVRIKDTRVGFLSALAGCLAATQLLAEFTIGEWTGHDLALYMNLPVSIFLVGAVVYTGRIIRDLHASEGSRDSTEAISRVVLETAVNGIILIDHRGTMVTVNRAVEKMFGYSRAELAGRNVNMLMPEPERTQHDGYIQDYLKSGQAKIIGIGRQVQGRRGSGALFPINLAVNEINLDGERFFAGVIQDLSELQKERDFVAATLETAGALIFVLDRRGQIVRFNRGCQELTGYDQAEVLGLPLDGFLLADERREVEGLFAELIHTGRPQRHTHHWRARAGNTYLVEWSCTTLRDGQNDVEFVVATGIDITEKRASQLKIERLSKGVIEVQEEERNRIAREIHDVLGQSLIALKIQIQNITFDIKDDLLLAQCRGVLDYINQIVQEARELSHSLSPLTLRNLGLNRAVRELARTYATGHKIKIEVDLDHIEHFFPNNWNDNLYRMIQEAVINAYKHAACDSIKILARRDSNGVLVAVMDNGRGLSPDPGEGLGLLIMQERARMVGAVLSLHSRSAGGTEVRIFLPAWEGNQ